MMNSIARSARAAQIREWQAKARVASGRECADARERLDQLGVGWDDVIAVEKKGKWDARYLVCLR